MGKCHFVHRFQARMYQYLYRKKKQKKVSLNVHSCKSYWQGRWIRNPSQQMYVAFISGWLISQSLYRVSLRVAPASRAVNEFLKMVSFSSQSEFLWRRNKPQQHSPYHRGTWIKLAQCQARYSSQRHIREPQYRSRHSLEGFSQGPTNRLASGRTDWRWWRSPT